MRKMHAQSIIQAFALHLYILKDRVILLAKSEGPDQTARMRRLVWAFAVRICLKTCFRMSRPILYLRTMYDVVLNTSLFQGLSSNFPSYQTRLNDYKKMKIKSFADKRVKCLRSPRSTLHQLQW